MRVTQEAFTVIPDPAMRELTILLGGMRITMREGEARLLATELNHGLGRLSVTSPIPAPSRATEPFPGPRPVTSRASRSDDGRDNVVAQIRSALAKVG
jgi:hypothetical protein